MMNDLPSLATGVPGLARAFELMQMGEEALAEFGVGQAEGAFMAIMPADGMIEAAADVYRSHARELAQRIRDRKKLDPPTDAELLLATSRASLACPLNEVGRCVFEALFVKVMGRCVAAGFAPREPWPGATQEEIEAMRRRYTTKRLRRE